jgi:hypothetical protein
LWAYKDVGSFYSFVNMQNRKGNWVSAEKRGALYAEYPNGKAKNRILGCILSGIIHFDGNKDAAV